MLEITQLNAYQKAALRTAKMLDADGNLDHGALGIASESGEYVSIIKAYLIYGKPMERDRAIRELGDLMWYIALSAEALGTNLSEIASININKLRERYPEKYSDELAIARLDGEPDEETHL